MTMSGVDPDEINKVAWKLAILFRGVATAEYQKLRLGNVVSEISERCLEGQAGRGSQRNWPYEERINRG